MAERVSRAIPVARSDLQSLLRAVEALTENVRVLTRQVADKNSWAATVAELEDTRDRLRARIVDLEARVTALEPP